MDGSSLRMSRVVQLADVPKRRPLQCGAALVLAFLCSTFVTPALSQSSQDAARSVNESVSAVEQWPRLPDGRAVMDIYGVGLAIPECPYCIENFEFRGEQYRGKLAFKDALAEPAKLRALIAAGHSVTLMISNSWIPNIIKGLFLGKFDPLSIPTTPRIDMTITSNDQPQECWLIPGNNECVALHSISHQQKPPGPDGLYIQSGLFRLPPESEIGSHTSSFFIQKGESLIVTPAGQYDDAIGLPMRMVCNLLQVCASSQHNGPPSFAIRPNVSLYFEVGQSKYSPSELVSAHRRLISAIEYLLVNSSSIEEH